MAGSVNPLRVQVEEFVFRELETIGPKRFDRPACVRQFMAAGAPRSSIERWIAAALKESPVTKRLEKRYSEPAEVAKRNRKVVSTEANARAAADKAQEVEDAEREISAEMRILGTAGSQTDSREALERLNRLIGLMEKVLEACFHEGKVRNARVAISAAASLRHILETAAKLYDQINTARAVESFMAEMMAAVKEADPETARRAVERMQRVRQRWSAS